MNIPGSVKCNIIATLITENQVADSCTSNIFYLPSLSNCTCRQVAVRHQHTRPKWLRLCKYALPSFSLKRKTFPTNRSAVRLFWPSSRTAEVKFWNTACTEGPRSTEKLTLVCLRTIRILQSGRSVVVCSVLCVLYDVKRRQKAHRQDTKWLNTSVFHILHIVLSLRYMTFLGV